MQNPRNPRTLSFFFDGIAPGPPGDYFKHYNTNNFKLYSLFEHSASQVNYYQPGYGPKASDSFLTRVAESVDKSFDSFLSLHLLDGYEFLVRMYNPGDKIFLFGFSRGAYVARALAGMLSKVGLLKEENAQNTSHAYRLYRSKSDLDAAKKFKIKYCHSATVEFLGVWETVASIGYNVHRSLPFANGNETVRVFRQALALDECHRRPPILYNREREQSIKEQATQEAWPGHVGTGGMRKTDIKEVWFIGTHADVGGGSTPWGSEYSISYISLRWMVQELVEAGYRHLFRTDPRTISATVHKLMLPSAERRPATPQDAVVRDLLDLDNFKQEAMKNRKTDWCLAFRRGRVMPPNPLFHNSVRAYMEKNPSYKPKAVYIPGSEQYDQVRFGN